MNVIIEVVVTDRFHCIYIIVIRKNENDVKYVMFWYFVNRTGCLTKIEKIYKP